MIGVGLRGDCINTSWTKGITAHSVMQDFYHTKYGECLAIFYADQVHS